MPPPSKSRETNCFKNSPEKIWPGGTPPKMPIRWGTNFILPPYFPPPVGEKSCFLGKNLLFNKIPRSRPQTKKQFYKNGKKKGGKLPPLKMLNKLKSNPLSKIPSFSKNLWIRKKNVFPPLMEFFRPPVNKKKILPAQKEKKTRKNPPSPNPGFFLKK